MKRIKVVAALVVFMLSAFAIAQNQDNQNKETPDMKRRNDQFRQNQANRPANETDYRQTKEYKAQSPAQQKQTDAAVQRANQGLNTLRSGGASSAAPAEILTPSRTAPSTRPSAQPGSQPVRDPFARPSAAAGSSSSGSGSSKTSSTTSSSQSSTKK